MVSGQAYYTRENDKLKGTDTFVKLNDASYCPIQVDLNKTTKILPRIPDSLRPSFKKACILRGERESQGNGSPAAPGASQPPKKTRKHSAAMLAATISLLYRYSVLVLRIALYSLSTGSTTFSG